MRWLALLVLCACNQILGIHGTRQTDASIPFFDGHPDAPFACPQLGTGAPKFQPGLYQSFQQSCQSYAISSKGSNDHAMGVCSSMAGYGISYGDVGADLQLATLTPPVPSAGIFYARLAPDDDQAIVGYLDTSASPVTTTFLLYARQSDGSWSELGAIGNAGTGFSEVSIISTPTRGTQRHVIALDYSTMQLDELVEGDGSTYPWTATTLQTIATNMPLPQGVLSLSPDGMRLVYFAYAGNSGGIYYADRTALLQPFGTPVWLMDLPQQASTDPFLVEDCSRLYLSGLGSIFYVVQ